MKAVIIPADDSKPIVRAEVGGYEGLTKAVDGWLQVIHYPNGNDEPAVMYLDEEGKLKGKPVNRRATAAVWNELMTGDFIVGDAVVVGFDDATGEDVDCPPLPIEKEMTE